MTKKDLQSFCKIIPLAPFYVLAPNVPNFWSIYTLHIIMLEQKVPKKGPP
jgi:hypothetical protein